MQIKYLRRYQEKYKRTINNHSNQKQLINLKKC